MIRESIIIFLIFLLAFFQNSFFLNFFSDSFVPDIILVIMIVWFSQRNLQKKWFRMVWAGFFLDMLSGGLVGLNIFSFLMITLMVSFLSERFFANQKNDSLSEFFVLSIFVILGTVLNSLITEIGIWGMQKNLLYTFNFIGIKKIGLKIFYNFIFLILIYWPIKRIDAFFHFRKRVLEK